jgi:phosphoglycolate phosphatase
MLRLIAFDLDGTLIDSRRDLADAVNALLAELDAAALPEEAVAGMVGEGAALLVRRALEAAALDPATPGALERFLELYDERLTNHTRPYDDVPRLLQTLKPGHELAVVTNKPTRATAGILAALHLDSFFRTIVGGDTPFGRKPDPAGLLHAAANAGARPETTLLVGDSPIDLETARRAGTSICLARYGFGYNFPGCAPPSASIIDSPLQLLDLVALSE